jgi:hypothetical protein
MHNPYTHSPALNVFLLTIYIFLTNNSFHFQTKFQHRMSRETYFFKFTLQD